MMRSDFCAFILSHGRANKLTTLNFLRKAGYTGKVYIVIDNEDTTANEYYDTFGKDSIVVFDKKQQSRCFDEADNFGNRKTIVYARNACFDIAESLGYKWFIQLDDDYYWFGYRTTNGGKSTRRLDDIFNYLVEFMENAPSITSVALSQGGDHIGGYDDSIKIKRKAMNSFICSTDRKFKFVGRINEDVNTYVHEGGLGKVFFTIMNLQLDQKDTQSNNSGMTDVYISGGTYLKSFYSVMINPSCVKVKMVGIHHKRIHHSIAWENAVPCIISEQYKK